MKNLPFILLFALFLFSECQQTPVDQSAKPIVSLPDSLAVAPPSWFCKAITTYPVGQTKAERAVGGKDLFWPVGTQLKIGFIRGSSSQIAAVKSYAAEWTQYANISFTYPTKGPFDIRISFNSNDGAWSYVGVENRNIPASQPTMNLGWIAPDVVKHEFGHALGLFHEHQNPNGGICWNTTNVIKDLSGPPNNWDVQTIQSNVLDKIDPATVLTSPWDRVSIMHYNIPANWTCNNVGIPGGTAISQADKDFIRLRYPGTTVNPTTTDVTLTASQVNDVLALLNARQVEADSNAARLQRSTIQVKKILGQ